MTDIALPPISKEDVLWIQPYIMRNPEPTSQIPNSEPEPTAPRYNLLDRLLLVAACSSALIAAVMWTINHGIWIGKQSVNIAQILPEDNSKNKAFAQEIQQMMTDITNKNRAIATGQSFTNTVGNNMPIVAAPMMANGLPMGNPVVGLQQPPMYVPVYQPPNLNNPNSPNLPSPLALPPANANNAVEVAPANSSNRKPPVTAARSVTAPAAPSSAYTLIGVLDLGDRSTAMLDMNGSVHSVGLGKAVGNSGWVLSRVSQQEIILKRGKETKSVFVGQKF
jgi:Tfp pilus assembly protein PilP